jgi:hypothetical protein
VAPIAAVVTVAAKPQEVDSRRGQRRRPPVPGVTPVSSDGNQCRPPPCAYHCERPRRAISRAERMPLVAGEPLRFGDAGTFN